MLMYNALMMRPQTVKVVGCQVTLRRVRGVRGATAVVGSSKGQVNFVLGVDLCIVGVVGRHATRWWTRWPNAGSLMHLKMLL